MVNRVSTAALHNTNLRYIGQLASERATLNQQISSGIKPQSYSDLTGAVERVSGFEEKISKIDTYLKNNTLVSTRLNATNSAIEQIQKITEEFISNVTLYNPSTENSFDLQAFAQSALDRIEDQLKVSVEGRYLFSGARTNTEPVGDINAALTTIGEADDNYYNGDNVKLSARVSDSYEMEYGVTANDPALQDLISGIRTAIAAVDNFSNAQLSQAKDLLNSAKTGLATLRANVNTNITALSAVNKQHEQLKLFWKESLSADIDTDLSEATIKLSANETILQSTFSAFAKISQLKLTDYLN